MIEQEGSNEEAESAPRISAKWLLALQAVVLPLVAFLLVAHTLKWEDVRVDTTTLALLAMILVTPLLGLVKKIRLGDFEAEIARDEVKRVRAKVADDLSTPTEHSAPSLEEEVRDLVRRDPPLAMAKVRIELEDAILRLHRTAFPGQAPERYQPLGRRVDELSKREVVTPQVSSAIRDVLSLANRAIHGERVDRNVGEDLAMLGVRLVGELREAQSEQLLAPIERSVIPREEVQRLRRGRYRVTTVVPKVPDAERRVYLLDQEGLDAFLEGYDEYGEFIVRIEAE